MRVYEANHIAVRGIGTVRVQFKDFDGEQRLVIVKGKRPSLLGLDLFPPLGIDITGVQHNDQLPSSLDSTFKDLVSVFDGTLGYYMRPPVHFALNPEVVPIRLKARRLPFAHRPKIDAELDKLVQQEILEPIDHARWETPIVTPLKANGDVRICAYYKCTMNNALQQHSYLMPAVSHLLAFLSGGAAFAKLDLPQDYQQLPVTDESEDAQTIATHQGAFRFR